MATQAQIEANQKNALLSTGPRTEEGKANSALNGRTHGLAGAFVLSDTEVPFFTAFRDKVQAQIKPVGIMEEVLVQHILHAEWNMFRCRDLEANDNYGDTDNLMDDGFDYRLNRYERYYRRNERSFYRAMNELRKLQTDRRAADLLAKMEGASAQPAEPDSPMVDQRRIAGIGKTIGKYDVARPVRAGVRPPVASPMIQ